MNIDIAESIYDHDHCSNISAMIQHCNWFNRIFSIINIGYIGKI